MTVITNLQIQYGSFINVGLVEVIMQFNGDPVASETIRVTPDPLFATYIETPALLANTTSFTLDLVQGITYYARIVDNINNVQSFGPVVPFLTPELSVITASRSALRARNRIKSEFDRDLDMLRGESLSVVNIVGATTFTYKGTIGPFETDVDVVSCRVTSAVPLISNAGTLLDIFNTTLTNNIVISAPLIDQQRADASTLAAQVPKSIRIKAENARVAAGKAISVRLVAAGDNSAVPKDLTVRLAYEIPLYDPGARLTSD